MKSTLKAGLTVVSIIRSHITGRSNVFTMGIPKNLQVYVIACFLPMVSCKQPEPTPEQFPALSAFDAKTPKLPGLMVDTTGKRYPWMKMYNVVNSIRERIEAPSGYSNLQVTEGSLAWWICGLPLKPGRPDVALFDGMPKSRQDVHHAVLNIDVGQKDLQQCADAVMRLRAEYLYSQGKDDSISFHFTSGAECPWSKWKQGLRPVLSGNQVTWKDGAATGRNYASFKQYLDKVFTYAGTASLSKELKRVQNSQDIQIGDVFIQGGAPGHAVMVVDVAVNDKNGQKIFLLAQSYMPAQEIHILKNPSSTELNPWYEARSTGTLETPEWTFDYAKHHMRF